MLANAPLPGQPAFPPSDQGYRLTNGARWGSRRDRTDLLSRCSCDQRCAGYPSVYRPGGWREYRCKSDGWMFTTRLSYNPGRELRASASVTPKGNAIIEDNRTAAMNSTLTLAFAATALLACLGFKDAVAGQAADLRVAQAPADLYVSPARGQSKEQLEMDRNECHARAVAKAGYDPNHASTGFQIGQKRLDYDRAIAACLQARGYTVK